MNDLTSIVGASPAVALMLALNAVGFGLKKIRQFPNTAIPLLLILLGGVAFIFIGNFGHPPPLYPKPLLFIYGVGIGFAAVGVFESGRTWFVKDDAGPDTPSPAVPPTTTTTNP